MGRIPRASKATKNGIKGRKTLKEMIDLKNNTHSIANPPLSPKNNQPFLFVKSNGGEKFEQLEVDSKV